LDTLSYNPIYVHWKDYFCGIRRHGKTIVLNSGCSRFESQEERATRLGLYIALIPFWSILEWYVKVGLDSLLQSCPRA